MYNILYDNKKSLYGNVLYTYKLGQSSKNKFNLRPYDN